MVNMKTTTLCPGCDASTRAARPFASRALIVWGAVWIAAGCSSRPVGPVSVERRAWASPAGLDGTQFLTEHYDIRTTSRDEILRDTLPDFSETVYREYRALLAPEREPDTRMVVYVFGERREWELFTRQFVPQHAATYLHILSGGYMDGATATSVFWDVKRDYTLSLLAHEGLHQYLARHRPLPVPAWLNEGLAAQFEDFELRGSRPVFRPERNLFRRNDLHEAITLADGFIPTGRLLAMHAGDAVTRTGRPVRGYYAQVWATILFLRSSPEYRVRFERLLADAGTERQRINAAAYRAAAPAAADMSEGEVIFRQYITDDLDGFTDALRAFCRDLVF